MIPQLLRSGLGSGKIDEIKKLHQAYRAYCSDKTDQLDVIFSDIMSQHDDEDFELNEVRKNLDDQLEAVIDVRYNLIFMEIQALLLKAPIEHELEPFAAFQEHPENNASGTSAINHQQEQVSPAFTSASQSSQAESQSQQDPAASAVDGTAGSPSVKNSKKDSQDTPPSSSSSKTDSLIPDTTDSKSQQESERSAEDLARLRKRNYELACKIAKPYELDHIILSTEQGIGFVVECLDYPFNIYDESATDRIRLQYLAWWWLVSMSEQDNTKESHVLPWKHTKLFRKYIEGDKRDNYDVVTNYLSPPPGVKEFLSMFIQHPEYMSDITFTDCFRLMENIRKVKGKYHEEVIWPLPLNEAMSKK
jgi:hypothetical protein